MSTDVSDSLKGQFLMAMPGMADPNFLQTVTCLCEHNDNGAMGLIINRHHPTLTAGDIFDELNIPCSQDAESIPIFIGGPVHMDELFILHGPPFDWDACLNITPGVGLSNTPDIFEAIAGGAGPQAHLICLGCAGWGPGQLEHEIKQNAWLTAPIFEKNIFEVPIDDRWQEAMRNMGIDPALLSDAAGHA
jgi:putative transcriptional regulator